MSDDSQTESVSLTTDNESDSWVSDLFKLTGAGGNGAVATGSKATSTGGTSGTSGPGTTGPDTCDTPEATATAFFFDKGLSDLTSSDKTFLEAYAKAYLSSKTSEKIK